MASIEMYEDIKREDHTYDVIKKQIETKHKFKPSLKQWLFLFLLMLTLLVLSGVVVWTVTYFTFRGTMGKISEERITDKLGTKIKNMLNGTIENISEDSRNTARVAADIRNMLNEMDSIKEKLVKILGVVSDLKHVLLPKECKDITNQEVGLHTIYPDYNRNMSVQCEEGGWTLIQKRYDGSVEFHRNWNDYENGFGDIHGEFWLGNKNIAQLTSEGNHKLKIDVEDWNGNKRYAVYGNFSIGDASTKYQLTISNYSGNAGDGMSYFNGMKFTTYDQDNDKRSDTNCADLSDLKGGWWYNYCWTGKEAILNGHYTHRNNTNQGIIYKSFKKTSLKKSTMKIRRL